MSETFFPTSTPAIEQELNAKITEQEQRINHLVMQNDSFRLELNEFRTKVSNVKGIICDVWSEDGEIPDHLTDIARILEIELTKRISGTASFEISWSAQVPIDFDADDFEISFDVNCETYEAEDFSWDEENTEVHGEDE